MAAEAIYRAKGIAPDLGQYLRLRKSTILMRGMCFVITELADGCYLPGLVWARPDVRLCGQAAAHAIAYTHDILSGIRELYWPGHINLITALAGHYRLDWSMSCGRYHVAAPQPPGELPSLFGG